MDATGAVASQRSAVIGSLAIDKLQGVLENALEGARLVPQWATVMIVVISMLCVVILLHVIAIVISSPCLWMLYTRRQRQARNRLLADDIVDSEELELSPMAEATVPSPSP